MRCERLFDSFSEESDASVFDVLFPVENEINALHGSEMKECMHARVKGER